MEEQLLKEGQLVWRCTKEHIVVPEVIIEVVFHDRGAKDSFYRYYCENDRSYLNRDVGKYIFETIEEAEAKAKRDINIGIKRKIMLEYEEKLNEILGLKDHFLIRKNKGE